VAQVRVLYADTDQMSVANNGAYLRWFEIGRAEWIRARGHTYREVEAAGYRLPVVEATLRYREPARYDDLLDIDAEPDDLRAASVRFRYLIRPSGESRTLCEGHTVHACLNRDGRVCRFPDELLAVLRPGA
jgi:acyl-CoA thioester hydrolase